MERRLAFQAITFGISSFRSNLKILIFSFLAALGVFMASIFVVATLLVISNLYLLKFVDPNFLDLLQMQTITMLKQLTMNHIVFFGSFAIVAIFNMFIIKIWLSLGFTKLMLNIYDQKHLSVRTIFSQFRRVFTVFAASILYGLLIAFGMLLLILPGIYWATRFYLYAFFIVDQNAGVIDSLRLSYRATKGAFWDVFFLFLTFGGSLSFGRVISGIFNDIGWLYPFVLLITIPLYVVVFLIANLSFAYLYRKLAKPQEMPVGV